jgi:hypothetical protein
MLYKSLQVKLINTSKMVFFSPPSLIPARSSGLSPAAFSRRCARTAGDARHFSTPDGEKPPGEPGHLALARAEVATASVAGRQWRPFWGTTPGNGGALDCGSGICGGPVALSAARRKLPPARLEGVSLAASDGLAPGPAAPRQGPMPWPGGARRAFRARAGKRPRLAWTLEAKADRADGRPRRCLGSEVGRQGRALANPRGGQRRGHG